MLTTELTTKLLTKAKPRLSTCCRVRRAKAGQHRTSEATANKNYKTVQPAPVDKNISRNSEASAGSKSFNRKSKLKKTNQTLATGWTKLAVINQALNSDTMYQQAESNSRRLNAQTQIPLITRQLMTNASNNNTNSRIDNCSTPTNNTVLFDRSNNQRKIKKNYLTNASKPTADIKPNAKATINLERAQSEINLLRQELKMKNIELQKLKSIKKLDKCQTPSVNEEFKSPHKSSLSTRRTKQKSRAKTGDRQTNEHTTDNLNRSNNQSDEYYETTKVSPTSSMTGSVYSKGISQIKSSQSCRKVDQDSHAANFATNNFATNNLCAVKESEEEQMAETFTKFGKKFVQPQQKDITKKNTPRQNHKDFVDNNDEHATSRDSSKQQDAKSKHKTNNRSKSNAKKSAVVNNVTLNFNLATKSKVGAKARGSDELNADEQAQTNNNINLPSINKNADSIKFETSLVGFATRSLSKNGAMKLVKAKTNLCETKLDPDMSSTGNLNSKNALINVPKKYQFRGKRLNIDSQSIASSNKSKAPSDNYQKQQTFHTKSGPIQVNEALNAHAGQTKPYHKTKKLIITDYKLKGVASPMTETSNFDTCAQNDDFSSAHNKMSPLKISTDEHQQLKASIKKFK